MPMSEQVLRATAGIEVSAHATGDVVVTVSVPVNGRCSHLHQTRARLEQGESVTFGLVERLVGLAVDDQLRCPAPPPLEVPVS